MGKHRSRSSVVRWAALLIRLAFSAATRCVKSHWRDVAMGVGCSATKVLVLNVKWMWLWSVLVESKWSTWSAVKYRNFLDTMLRVLFKCCWSATKSVRSNPILNKAKNNRRRRLYLTQLLTGYGLCVLFLLWCQWFWVCMYLWVFVITRIPQYVTD